MLENRKFLSLDDGEVISDELLTRSSIGREIRLRTTDVSKTLEKIGFTALGIAVTPVSYTHLTLPTNREV